jgi:hypothetical protein
MDSTSNHYSISKATEHRIPAVAVSLCQPLLCLYFPSPLIMTKRKHWDDEQDILPDDVQLAGRTITWTITNYDEGSIYIRVDKYNRFKVSKPVLLHVPWFKDLLSWQSDRDQYHMQADDPKAFEIVLRILHHQLNLLPVDVSTETLFSVALLSARFNLVQLIKPHVLSKEWMRQYSSTASPNQRYSILWPTIIQIFGRQKDLELANILLASRMFQHDGTWFINCNDISQPVSTIRLRFSGKHNVLGRFVS